MRDLLGRNESPSSADTIISVGRGQIWKYALSGIPNLWVEGGIFFEEEGYSCKFHNIQQIHDKICDHILSQPVISAEEFRFLRKEIQLTVSEFAEQSRLPLTALQEWESGDGFAVHNAETTIRQFYSAWRKRQPLPKIRAA